MPKSKAMTLEYDEKTDAVLEELKSYFGVKTKAEAIRRALAIARNASKLANEDGILSVNEPDTNETVRLGLGT